MSLLIKNISHLYTPLNSLPFGEYQHLTNTNILVENGLISKISDGNDLTQAEKIIDAHGQVVLPGFVDAHTHPVFWKTREAEFIMRIQGKSYEEIANAGGGIRNSVRRFREASKGAIKGVTRNRIKRFFEFGTTTIEAKSGYGLTFDDEIKSLEIIKELNEEQSLEMIPTFLGAHEIPDEYQQNRAEYINIIKNKMIPYAAENNLAQYCDVFCEKGVYTVQESRDILQTAMQYGLKARIHADELNPFGGAELAGEIKAVTADHLVRASDEGIAKMAENGVIPILLPGTTFFLRKDEYAAARKMIEAGCKPALATDYNPGSSATQNIQLIWSIAALKMGMLPGELLCSTTLISAKSLSLDHKIGTIEVGKQADMVILDIPNLDYLPYNYGVNNTTYTIKRGEVVYEKRL
jgi:imidazolonepropionase